MRKHLLIPAALAALFGVSTASAQLPLGGDASGGLSGQAATALDGSKNQGDSAVSSGSNAATEVQGAVGGQQLDAGANAAANFGANSQSNLPPTSLPNAPGKLNAQSGLNAQGNAGSRTDLDGLHGNANAQGNVNTQGNINTQGNLDAQGNLDTQRSLDTQGKLNAQGNAAAAAPTVAPNLENGAQGAANANLNANAATTTSASNDDQWRFRQHNGRWWYWIGDGPDGRWTYWQNGAWNDYTRGAMLQPRTTPGQSHAYQSQTQSWQGNQQPQYRSGYRGTIEDQSSFDGPYYFDNTGRRYYQDGTQYQLDRGWNDQIWNDGFGTRYQGYWNNSGSVYGGAGGGANLGGAIGEAIGGQAGGRIGAGIGAGVRGVLGNGR